MNFLNSTKTKPAVWIDFIHYANRLFAAGRNNLWSNEDTYISIFSQGQSLIKSDVLGISIHNFYRTWLSNNMDLIQTYTGKKTTFILKKIVAADEPKSVIKNVLSGFVNLYNGSKPIALVVPSPQLWLNWLYSTIRPEEVASLGENEIEAAAMYLAEFLRDYSSFGISTIVLEEDDQSSVRSSEMVTLYKPVINIARHYQWSTGLLIDGTAHKDVNKSNDLDFFLIKGSDFSELSPLLQENERIGGGLNAQFWSGQQINTGNSTLVYGEVPENADPETVLAQLKSIRE
ncbi:hypothetical protein ACNQFZ_20235 [Schinkia sp. CFF1]